MIPVAKRWDCRNRDDLIESATPCHDAQVVGLYRDLNPLCLTILAAMSEDYTTAPQHLQVCFAMFGSSLQSGNVRIQSMYFYEDVGRFELERSYICQFI